MVRPWKPPSAATTVGPAGAPADLERGLVGLGAGVAEEHPARRGRQVEQPLGQRERRLVMERLETWPSVATCSVTASTTAGWAWPRS